MKITNSEILDQYIKSGNISYKATLEGDYKSNNKEYGILTKIYKYLEKNVDIAEETLPLLFDNENIDTRTTAAAHCLALRIKINEAIKVLEDASKEDSIFGFNAGMTLKVWKEKGSLDVYQKKKS